MTYTILNPECLPYVRKVLAEYYIEQYYKAVSEGRISKHATDSSVDNTKGKKIIMVNKKDKSVPQPRATDSPINQTPKGYFHLNCIKYNPLGQI